MLGPPICTGCLHPGVYAGTPKIPQDKWCISYISGVMYDVWSETNAQSEITFIWIIFEMPLFQDFFRPSSCQLRQTFHRGTSTAKWQWRTRLWRWFEWPHPSSSRWSPRTRSPTQKQFCRSNVWWIEKIVDHLYAFLAFGSPGMRWRRGGIVPVQKLVLGRQSGAFQCKNRQGLCHSILEADCINNFAAGLSKQWQQKQSQCLRSFSSFLSFFVFSSFYEEIWLVLWHILVHIHTLHQWFFSTNILQPWWARQWKRMHPS